MRKIEDKIKINQPEQLVFGAHCAADCISDLIAKGKERVFIVLAAPVEPLLQPLLDTLGSSGIRFRVSKAIDQEPTVHMFEEVLVSAQKFGADAVLGIGGGSVLDVAKLVAALLDGEQGVREVLGIGNLAGRPALLHCLPTTAGTGSEVSPNAILLDERENLKKGIISPFLVPDATYVDPELTKTVPASVTAATGLDALTHCIEAYANRFAHPVIDLYALEGIRLIGSSLQQTVEDGQNTEARTKMALGSMYGGLCLGPVNTAAIHALSYPLGSEFHIAHGISNAVLLPHVLEFNLKVAPNRYARIAEALGVKEDYGTDSEKAEKGVAIIRDLMKSCGVPEHMASMGVPADAIDGMAEASMSVTRLLKNNLRPLTKDNAREIYQAAY